MKKILALAALLVLTGAGCVMQNQTQQVQTPTPDKYKNWKTVEVGGIVSFQIPPNCEGNPGAGSNYIACPTATNTNPDPEFVFSSDGIQANMHRWQGKQSVYWNDVLASMKVIQPLTHNIQINIDK